MSFGSDNVGSFVNRELEEIEGRVDEKFFLANDTVLVFGRHFFEVIKIDKDNLVMIWRSMRHTRLDNDLKLYFIRKSAFGNLSNAEIEKLKAPTQRDYAYQDSCLNEKGKQWDYELHGYYLYVELMPSFPGGIDSLQAFITRNISRTSSDCKGTAALSFVIDTAGKPSNVEVIKSLCSDFDDDAVQLIKAMPNWKPGRQDGKTVNVRMTLPIHSKQE